MRTCGAPRVRRVSFRIVREVWEQRDENRSMSLHKVAFVRLSRVAGTCAHVAALRVVRVHVCHSCADVSVSGTQAFKAKLKERRHAGLKVLVKRGSLKYVARTLVQLSCRYAEWVKLGLCSAMYKVGPCRRCAGGRARLRCGRSHVAHLPTTACRSPCRAARHAASPHALSVMAARSWSH